MKTKTFHDLSNEHNYCGSIGFIVYFLEYTNDVIIVNGPRFCYLQMRRFLEFIFYSELDNRLYCTDIDEDAIIYGTEKKLKLVLNMLSPETNRVIVVNSCAVNMVGDDIKGITAAVLPNAECISVEGGLMLGDIWEGYRRASRLGQDLGINDKIKLMDEINIIGYSHLCFNSHLDLLACKRMILPLLESGYTSFKRLDILLLEELSCDIKKKAPTTLNLGFPIGFIDSISWLLKIAQYLNVNDVDSYIENINQSNELFRNEENNIRANWGDVFIPYIIIAAPMSLAIKLAQCIKKELAIYERLFILNMDNKENYFHINGVEVVDNLEQIATMIEIDSTLLLGSSNEFNQLYLRFNKAPYFIPVTNPNHNKLMAMPIAGLEGYYHLKELFWDIYINIESKKLGQK